MSRIVVVGGGLGGLASAARLAKTGHEVALVEAADTLGGALGGVAQDGFTWDGGPTSTLLPAAIRDLFRKTGRPLETELGGELEPLQVIREHRFADRSRVQVRGGSRAAQLEAFEDLGTGLGHAWIDHVDSYAPVWDLLRQEYVEVPWDRTDPRTWSRDLTEVFRSRDTLYKRLRRTFRDDRLALVGGYRAAAEGHDLRNVPWWVGVDAYLEQTFGVWTVPGGMARLADLLSARLETRGVKVLTDTEVEDLVVEGGRAVAVRTSAGAIDADAVVVAVDPRRLPALARHVERTMPAIPPVVAHLGLTGTDPDLPAEVVIHDEPQITIRTGGGAPEGHSAWTLHGRGKIAEDIVEALVRHGVDVRDRLVTRIDRSPLDLVGIWRGSPNGVLWQGRGTVQHRLGPTTPVAGVYAAGAHAAPGSGVAFVAQSAALVAQVIGPA